MRLVPGGVVVVLAVGLALAPLDPGLVERQFSAGLYPAIQRVVTPVTNLVPFALFDLLTVSAAVALVVVLWRGVRTARTERRWRPLLTALRRLVVAAAAAYLIFLALWGFNYRRVAMPDRLHLTGEAPSTERVVELGLEAVRRLNDLHTAAHTAGWTDDPRADQQLTSQFAAVQRMLGAGGTAVPGRLKATLYGTWFRWTSVDGMVNPFALEVLANPDLLPFERPMVAAHEWAHLAGYADESEANFVGWLTCVRGGAGAQYSGWLYLYWQIYGEVGVDDRTRLAKALDAGPRRDTEAVIDRLRRGQFPLLQRASWRVYDQYLRANRVEEGVRSYGEVINLILRAQFDEGWSLRLRAAP